MAAATGTGDTEFERNLARSESRRHQRNLVPLAVGFLGIALQPFVGSVAITREVASYIGILASIGIVLTHFVVDAEPAEPAKLRSVYGRHAKWVIRALAHIICFKYDHQAHNVLLRLLSVVIFPLSGARDEDGILFNFYLVTHFLFTLFHVGDAFAEEGWQWLLILVIYDMLLWDMSGSVNDQRETQVLLNRTSQVIQSLLGTICDGCLLLGDDGRIVGADQKAANLLNLELARGSRVDTKSAEPSSAPQVGSVLEGVLEGGRLVRGLRMLQLPTGLEERLQVEAYIIPCPMAAKDTVVLGLQASTNMAAGRVHLCAFRLADGGFEPKATPTAASAASTIVPRLKGTTKPTIAIPTSPQIASRGQLGPSQLGGSPPVLPSSGMPGVMLQEQHSSIGPDGSIVDSGVGSPRTQAASAVTGAGPAPAFPGIPLQSISAVGLGVGSYTKVRVVGRGTQGQVWQVTSQGGTCYALKEIGLKGVLWHRDFPKRLRDADREVRALKGLAWAACVVVPIVDCWIQKDFEMSCIVMEWLPKNLDSVLKKLIVDKSGPVPLSRVCSWLARLAAGLGAIHAAGFIHRDLKPSNILLDETLQQCKITDLGVSRALHRQGPWESTLSGDKGVNSGSGVDRGSGGGGGSGSVVGAGSVVSRSEAPEEKFSMVSENMGSILSGYTVRPGTIAYTSPEACESCHYGPQADIFSLGVLALEVISLETPPEPRLGEVYSPSAAMERAEDLLAKVPPGNDPNTWVDLRKLCICMLRPHPEERPSARELCTSRVLLPHVEQLVPSCPKLKILLLQNSGSTT